MTFKKTVSLLLEQRKNKEINKKENPVEIISRYCNDDSYLLSFRSMNKMGIRPTGNHTSTPAGIYCWPIKHFANSLKTHGLKAFPYSNNQPFIYIVKEKSGLKLATLKSFKQADYDNALNILKTEFSERDVSNAINYINNRFYGISGLKKIYELSRILYVNKNINITNSEAWMLFFKNKLGYDGLKDTGDGWIYGGTEPHQTVYFSNRCFDIIKVIEVSQKINKGN